MLLKIDYRVSKKAIHNVDHVEGTKSNGGLSP